MRPLRFRHPVLLATIGMFALAPALAGAQRARIDWSTRHPEGGRLVQLRVTLPPTLIVPAEQDGAPRQEGLDIQDSSQASPSANPESPLAATRAARPPSHDSLVDIRGSFAGEPLHFHWSTGDAVVTTFGAVPTTASDSIAADVVLVYASGRRDSLHDAVRFPHQPPPPPPSASAEAFVSRSRARRTRGRRLKVDRRFTVRQDSATLARIDDENELARDIGRSAHETPRLWTEPFILPRQSRITSGFGTGRVFNGRLASSHLGIDLRGALGDSVRAANRGVVSAVSSFYLAGNVIYVDHGDGLVTGYFHLSQPLVAVGDTVERGQTLGLVGATGRVTGPHLHWAARYGAAVFDPLDLIRLTNPTAMPVSHARKSAAKRKRRTKK